MKRGVGPDRLEHRQGIARGNGQCEAATNRLGVIKHDGVEVLVPGQFRPKSEIPRRTPQQAATNGRFRTFASKTPKVTTPRVPRVGGRGMLRVEQPHDVGTIGGCGGIDPVG